MKNALCTMILLCLSRVVASVSLLRSTSIENKDNLINTAKPLRGILQSSLESKCFIILVTDKISSTKSHFVIEELQRNYTSWGVAHFSLSLEKDANKRNETEDLLTVARKLRRLSWCGAIVTLSNDLKFLETFGKYAQSCRLLVWTTKLIVVTDISPNQLSRIASIHWTYSMMNAIFLNSQSKGKIQSWKVYTYLPYSPEGPIKVMLAAWSNASGLQIKTNRRLFPEKYTNFHGATVNVTSLPYPPYWIEEEFNRTDGTKGMTITGTDGMLLQAVAGALNFSFSKLPTKDWNEVLDLVVDRQSFISPILWTILPERLARFDMTYVYTWTSVAFCKSKPPMTANWQSLKDPLSDRVWLGILLCLFIAPGVLYATVYMGGKFYDVKETKLEMAIMEIVGTFLGQEFRTHLPRTDSGRLWMVVWLIFTFIIGSAYQGNLTAHLTLPSFPPRPETIEELVDAVDVVMGASYISYFKEFFSKSNYPPFKKLGSLITSGQSVHEGMQTALEDTRSAYTDVRRYMELAIATDFTRPDGTTDLYLGRSNLLPGQAGWAIPHDAPYKSNLDSVMQAAIEGGLYEKWSSDLMAKARRESMRKQREYLSRKNLEEEESSQALEKFTSDKGIQALTIDHMKAPLVLISIGLVLSVASFASEMLTAICSRVTGASYIRNFREFFSKSDFLPYQKLSTMMTIGIGAKEGMRRALKDQRSALMDIPAYMGHLIATQFTRPDGSTDIYIGKSSLLTGQAGLPVPHDAPFKIYLDKSMQSAIEAGLYTKWSSDLMDKARRESMQKQRTKDESQGGDIKDVVDATTSTNQDDS